MNIEYVTLITDYKHDKKNEIKKLLIEIEDKLVCALCVEKVTKDFKRIKRQEPFAYQMVWNLI
ncbi:MAG: hypothetical protein A2255_07000 [Candidatus Melainabacteria bacterium RIFOXYA2_FULL_32_9]|nr:MAG: hypothetical protein A2255_07000 [Candidatus Melainabacteria bacterium RIFOXYA2_FULL_32_9]